MDHGDREDRRAARRRWAVRVYRLGEEPSDDLSGTTTAMERWDMMAQLARDAWAAAGRSIPQYERSEIPCVVRRLDYA